MLMLKVLHERDDTRFTKMFLGYLYLLSINLIEEKLAIELESDISVFSIDSFLQFKSYNIQFNMFDMCAV